ncbi:MAG TPA: metalloregulator ArsR/SmtB family transcription factor [Gaiellaceae bacterium]
MKKLRVFDQPCCAPGAPPLPKEAARALARRFKALSDPARVEIVNRIAGAGEICTCQLTGPLGLSQPTVSHHLRVLREAGLIELARRRGTWSFYRLVPGTIEQLAFTLGGAREAAGVLVTRQGAVAW